MGRHVRTPAPAQTLPPELLLGIFARLSGADRARAGAVCTHWYRCANDDSSWRDLYARDLYARDLAGWERPPTALPRRPPEEALSWRCWYDQRRALDLAMRREDHLESQVRDLSNALSRPCTAVEAARTAGYATVVGGVAALTAAVGAPLILVGGGLYAGSGAALSVLSAAVGTGFVGLGAVTLGRLSVASTGVTIVYHGVGAGVRRVSVGTLAGIVSVALAAAGPVVATASAAVVAASSGVAVLAAPGLVYRLVLDARWRRPALHRLLAAQQRNEAELGAGRARVELLKERWRAAHQPPPALEAALSPDDTPTAAHP